MKLVLAHCGKEWRAQRGLLTAYLLLVFGCLALGLWLTPEHAWNDDTSGGRAWFDEGLGAHAVTWFFASGVLGVLLFVAPGLVRAEFGTKDDQFVRRLPGALAPSFHGKLLFLLLASAALPLLGLLVGEIYVSARGHTWNNLFTWRWDGEVLFDWPGAFVACGCAMLLVPWIWAIGTWLPGGRMAVGGTVLFVLLAGVCVFAVLRQSPAIERHIGWQMWTWWVAPLGLAVVAMSWCHGRRGGGPLRSARFGLAATAIGFVPPSAWLANEAWAYHHPDLQRLGELHVQGLSPDGRFALALGNTHQQWECVKLRIELETGQAEQITGISTVLCPEGVLDGMGSGLARHWYECVEEGQTPRRFDLVEGRWSEGEGDEISRRLQGTSTRRGCDSRERTYLRAPGDRRVWFDGDVLCTEQADGTVARRPMPDVAKRLVCSAGHGFRVYGKDDAYYDAYGNRLLKPDEASDRRAWVVRDRAVFQWSSGGNIWAQRMAAGTKPCAPLAGCSVLGLFDDDHLLAARVVRKKGQPPKLFLYRPADDAVTELEVPADVPCQTLRAEAPLAAATALLARDPAQCVWLYSWDARGDVFLRIDTQTRAVTPVLPHRRGDGSHYRLLDWPDAESVRVSQDEKILRFDLRTGERTVLFPRR